MSRSTAWIPRNTVTPTGVNYRICTFFIPGWKILSEKESEKKMRKESEKKMRKEKEVRGGGKETHEKANEDKQMMDNVERRFEQM